MHKWLIGCCAILALFSSALAQNEHEAQTQEDIEEVLVSGEQPGPGLWKVSKGDHALWILGTHSPLPKSMSWKSKDVEALVAQSQEVLIYGGLNQRADIGWFRGLLLLPSVLGAAKNPDGAKLEDVLPADLHRHWLALKAKYIGKDNGIERWRPTFALQQLRSKAMAKSGLAYRSSVRELILKTAKKHKVKVSTTQVEQKIEVEKPRALLKRFSKTPFDDLQCFSHSLERFEQDLQELRDSANAWSVGDISALRQTTARTRNNDCINILVNAVLKGELTEDATEKQLVQQVVDDTERANRDLAEKWLAATEAALADNHTTVAVAPIAVLLLPEGFLAQLSARGYAVRAPEDSPAAIPVE